MIARLIQSRFASGSEGATNSRRTPDAIFCATEHQNWQPEGMKPE
jgi:hypothetical protein